MKFTSDLLTEYLISGEERGEASIFILPCKSSLRHFWWVGRFLENMCDVLLWQSVKTAASYPLPTRYLPLSEINKRTLNMVQYFSQFGIIPHKRVEIPFTTKRVSLWLAIFNIQYVINCHEDFCSLNLLKTGFISPPLLCSPGCNFSLIDDWF